MKKWLWKNIGDPILERALSRMDHLRARRSPLSNSNRWHPMAKIGNNVQIHRNATFTSAGRADSLRIDDACIIYGHIWLFGAGELTIGHHSFLGPGSRIWAAENLVIGSYVLISHLVDIHDSNFHSVHWENRRREIGSRFDSGDHSMPPDVVTSQVVIEDDVWIGFKSSILKGVTIGRGAIVAAGSVVTKDVPPYTLVAGNPAQIVRELPQ